MCRDGPRLARVRDNCTSRSAPNSPPCRTLLVVMCNCGSMFKCNECARMTVVVAVERARGFLWRHLAFGHHKGHRSQVTDLQRTHYITRTTTLHNKAMLFSRSDTMSNSRDEDAYVTVVEPRNKRHNPDGSR
jgi:hypothetical protein